MGSIVAVVVAVGVAALTLSGFAWLAIRARNKRVGHPFMTPFEELWQPAAHRAEIVIQAMQERGDPAPAPGDPPDPAPTV